MRPLGSTHLHVPLAGAVGLAVLVLIAPLAARQFIPIDARVLSTFSWRPLGPANAELVSITTDQGFPYRACGTDASGHTGCATVHPDPGTSAAWEPLPFMTEGPVFPDPVEGDLLYTSWVRRYDRRTGQASWVGPDLSEQLRGRLLASAITFSLDGRAIFAGRRSVWRSNNAGQGWAAISPDLPGADGVAPTDAHIAVLATSPLDTRVLWAGTSRGTVHLTRDGGASWAAATPPIAIDATRIEGLEPSRFDPQSAYVTTSGDPSGSGATVWRTRNLGATWTNIGLSLPAGTAVHAVREDPFRRGLLVAATSAGVAFSVDDGGHWESLTNNLPGVPVTGIVIRDADLIVATRGRGAWVLDDFSPLRQLTADVLRAGVFLFRPPTAWRLRASTSAGDAMPAGVAVTFLAPATDATTTIDIIETATGETIRRFAGANADSRPGDEPIAVGPGLRRILWDLRYTRPERDPNAPAGARVLPGTYQVRLTTAGQAIRQSVAVRLDPRVRAAAADLAAQRTLARALDRRRAALADRLANQPGSGAPALTSSLDELRRFARAVNDVDGRPSVTLETAALDALARAQAAIDASPQPERVP